MYANPSRNQPEETPWGASYGPFEASYYYLYSPGTGLMKDLYQDQNGPSYDTGMGTGLDLLLGQRREVLSSKVELIAREIEQRRYLKERNLYQINLDQCVCRDTILLRGEDVWDRDRFKLEQSLLDLEREKRMSQESYFRDLLFLKRELREALIEGLEEDQKAAVLTNYPGVNP